MPWLDAERGQSDANIGTYGDAVWWALTTVSTVGYGDHFPVTVTGRSVAGGLMVAGIALLGTLTATRRDVEALTREVAALREESLVEDRAGTPSSLVGARRRTPCSVAGLADPTTPPPAALHGLHVG